MALKNRIELPLGLGYWNSRSEQNNKLTLQNMYPEADPMGKSKVALYPSDGTRFVSEFTPGDNIRALLPNFSTSSTKQFFVVCGRDLHKCTLTGKYTINIDASFELTNFADSATNVPVELIQTDNDNLFILEPNSNFAYNLEIGAEVLTEITDADYPTIVHTGCTIDTYVIVSLQDSAKFYISDVADPLSWDATRLATAEASPDLIVRVLANLGYLWIFGSNTTEVWFNSANPDFPFEPMPSAYFNFGLLSPTAVTNVNGTLFLLASSASGALQFVRIDSFQSKVVSTPAVDEILYRIDQTNYHLSQYQSIGKNIVVNHYFKRGHTFVYITVPPILDKEGTGFTIIYDPTTELWHTRSFNTTPTSFLSTTVMNLYGFSYMGDDTDNSIYCIDSEAYVDKAVYSGGILNTSAAIDRVIITQYFDKSNANIQWHLVELEVAQPALSQTIVLPGGEPYIKMSYSDDGGESWSTPISRLISETTGDRYRIRWSRLGASRDRVFKFETDSSIPLYISSCHADITVGTA